MKTAIFVVSHCKFYYLNRYLIIIINVQVLSAIVAASAAPQGLFSFPPQNFGPQVSQGQFVREIETVPEQEDANVADLVNLVIRGLSALRGTSRNGPPRRPNGEGNLMRILFSLVARELGLVSSDSRSDSIDQEVIIRNLIKTFTNIVGNALLS